VRRNDRKCSAGLLVQSKDRLLLNAFHLLGSLIPGTYPSSSFICSSGDVPNDQGTERSSFCSALVSADETTLGKSLTNVCRLFQRDLSFLSSFGVIAPQATAASPENV